MTGIELKAIRDSVYQLRTYVYWKQEGRKLWYREVVQ